MAEHFTLEAVMYRCQSEKHRLRLFRVEEGLTLRRHVFTKGSENQRAKLQEIKWICARTVL